VSRDNRHGNVSSNIGQATNRVNANKAGHDQGREHPKQSTSNRVEEDVLANARCSDAVSCTRAAMSITCAGLEVCSTRQEQQSRMTSSLIERCC
jgi:hypothetical protein